MKLRLKYIVLFLIINIPSFGSHALPHAIYISVIEMQHVEGSNEYSLEVKVFSKDLKDCLRNYLRGDLVDNDSLPDLKDLTKYFSNYIQIKVNNQNLQLECSHILIENDTYRLQFVGKCPDLWDSLELKAGYLMEIFTDQSNILNLSSNGSRYFHRFTLDEQLFKFNF